MHLALFIQPRSRPQSGGDETDMHVYAVLRFGLPCCMTPAAGKVRTRVGVFLAPCMQRFPWTNVCSSIYLSYMYARFVGKKGCTRWVALYIVLLRR